MTTPVNPEAAPVSTAQARYALLETERNTVLAMARQASSLTLPALMPPEGTSDATKLPQPYSSVGARGVNNLAAKLLLVLFPPGSSFFRLDVDEFILDTLKKKALDQGVQDPQADIDTSLAKVEKGITKKLEEKNFRATAVECLKHLVICGNGLLQTLASGVVKFYSLASYVLVRDASDEPVEIIVREGMLRETLSPEALAILTASGQVNEAPTSDKSSTPQPVYVYTWVRRNTNVRGEKSWITHQEIAGKKIPGTDGQYPIDSPAFMPLRWEKVSGANYGRGHVEQYLGDHLSAESLSKSLVEGAAAAAKVLWMVDEGGTTQKRTISRAPNNAVVDGNSKDVSVLQMEKFNDFRVAQEELGKIERRLEQAYLQTSSIQRNAERVTAEEIRLMAGELETALGGTYSLLGGELQRPLVVRLMAVMTKARLLPPLPKGVVSPTIIAGLDGLGRSTDLQKLDLLLQGAEAYFGAEGVAEYVSAGAYIKRRAAALNIDVTGLVRSEEQVQQSRAAAQQEALNQKGIAPTIKAVSDQSIAAQQQGASQPQ